MSKRIVKQGDTIRKYIKFVYKGSGDPVDLTECVIYSNMRSLPDKELKARGTGKIDELNGLIWVTYTSEQTSELPEGNYGYDIRLESQGDVITIYEEQFSIVKPYTFLSVGAESTGEETE